MQNMSFSMTMRSVRDHTKTITRRLGWKKLKPGALVQAVEKGQGLKRGERVVKICVIRIISNETEPLCRISSHGMDETAREGFPGMPTSEFVYKFCRANKCATDRDVQRIVFEYV
jgi:hypothetical protein